MKLKLLFSSALLAAVFALTPLTARAGDDMRFIRDAEIERTLKTFSTPVLQAAGLSPETVRFILVESDDLNAFVAGGQNIFLNTGLILATENPEELIGVIAHEAGHIASGHLFRSQEVRDNVSLQTVLTGLLAMAAAIGTHSGEAGMAAMSAGQSLAESLILRHSRGQESAADQSGVRFLQEAGLPVTGFLSFMKKLASQELLPASQQMEYVRTHPLTQDRIDFLQNVVARSKAPPAPHAEWQEMHARIRAKLKGFLFPERALADKGETTGDRYARAIALYRQGKIMDALKQLETLIEKEPRNPYFHELQGQILLDSGKAKESLPPYARAVELLPDAPLLRAAYGHALVEAGKPGDAIRQLELALNEEPSPRVHHLLAIAYGKAGQEGLSRLHLAEESILQGKLDFAEQDAKLARDALPKDSPGHLRALDILDAITRLKGKKKP